jgi:D-amino-acid dehydrogenase
MSTLRDADVAIIGGGVIGLSTALQLLHAGRSVVVLERRHVGAGASHGNCGTLTPSHALPLAQPGMVRKAIGWMLSKDAPFYVRPRPDPALLAWLLRFAANCRHDRVRSATLARASLLHLSRQLLEDIVRDEGMACEFETRGTLTVYRSTRAFDEAEAQHALLADAGVAVETWRADDLLRREPALKPGVAGAHWYPGDAMLRPDRFVAELARRVRELGGEIREGLGVEGFGRDGDRCVPVVDGRPIATREVLMAVGAWTPALAATLGLRVPMQPGKGYSVTYDRPALAPTLPMVLRERSVCVTTWGSGFRLGSTMEFSGYDESLNRLRLDALARGAAEYLHEPEGPVRREEWFGWRPMMSDDLPLIGRSSRIGNLWFATGHGMLGVTMSAATARCIVDLMLERAPPIAMQPFAPARFGL